MLSKKLFDGVGIDRLLAKTAIGSENLPLSPLPSLLSAHWPSFQVQAVI
jgi:hypothetical protein